jgi:hypothetical protein
MKRTTAAVLYWLAAITITLGAYGHGFVGVKSIRAALAAVALDPHTLRVIWIVWYFVSGAMLVCGVLLFWAWPGFKPGAARRAGAALIVGTFYGVTGFACYVYSGGEPFWLLFVAQGVLVIGSTVVLSAPQK